MVESFLHTWPYLLITIPIAVGVKMSGTSKYINRAFTARPVKAIILATFVSTFSPLCSCSVIPVVAALLIGGVPLALVRS
ncbi:MAG: permease [Anaerolineales bacterium]|nr:permease [Anaerolineales bacterium]